MHEYSLADNLIESITTQLAAEGVTSPDAVKEVTLRVGVLEIHSEESFRQAIQMRAGESVLSKAQIRLEIVPGSIKCQNCGHEEEVGVGDADVHEAVPAIACPKCGAPCIVQGGRGIEPIQIEVE